MSYELRHQKVTIHLDMSQGRAPNKVEGILKGRDAEFIKVERFNDKMVAWYPVQHVLWCPTLAHVQMNGYFLMSKLIAHFCFSFCAF